MIRDLFIGEETMDDAMNERGIDLLQPVYNMLDLILQGRGCWYASLDYGATVKR